MNTGVVGVAGAGYSVKVQGMEVVNRGNLAPRQRRNLELRFSDGFDACAHIDATCALPADAAASALDRILAAHDTLRLRVTEAATANVGPAPRTVVHAPLTRDAAAFDEAIATLTHAQRTRIVDASGQCAIQADVVATGPASCRVLLTAAPWSADRASLLAIAAALHGDATALQEPELHYADIAAWLDALPDDAEAGADRDRWAADAGAHDAWRRDGRPARSAHCRWTLPADLAARLGARTEAFLLGAWLRVVACRHGLVDAPLVLGCRADARGVDGLADVVGPLARTVPVSFPTPAGVPFWSWCAAQADALARARDTALYWREPADARPWRYAFDYVRAPADVHDATDAIEPASLALCVVETAQHCRVDVHYDAALYDAADIQWLLAQLSTLLAQAVADPQKPAQAFDLADAAQRAYAIQAGTGPALAATVDFLAAFDAARERSPDAPALHCGDERLSYAQLDAAANRFARLLYAEGCRAGARVAVCLPRSIRQIVSLVGTFKAGCSYVPIDPAYPPRRIAQIMAGAGVAFAVSSTEWIDKVSEAEHEVVLIDWTRDAEYIETLSDAPLPLDGHPEREAYAIYTSGSTGEPKGVSVSQRALANYVAAIGERLGIDAIGSMAALSTVAADLGYTALFGALGHGACLRLIDEALSLDAAALADELAAAPVDCLKIVPSHLAALLAVGDPARVLPRRALVFGGEALPRDLVERVHALAPSLRVVNHYGPTETTIGIVCNTDVDAPPRDATVPLGRVLANNRVHVLDAALRVAPVGVEGDLYLAGANLATGYVDRPAATAAAFVPDPFATAPGARLYASGDRAVIDAHGRVVFRGRADHQVKLRGFRIELGEIETAIRATGLADAAAVVVRSDGGPPRLVAYVTGCDATRENALRDELAARLPEYMQPAVWCRLERLPLNANGKLDRNALPAPERRTAAERDADPTEATLLAICRELLGTTQIGLDDDFFALGADSIVAIQLVARARQHGLYFSPKQVFEQQTIAALARVAERRAADAGYEQGEVAGDAPLTAIQSRYFARVRTDAHHYNQSVLYDLPADVDAARLRAALGAVLRHHDALRARFVPTPDGGRRQQFDTYSDELLARSWSQTAMPAEVDAEAALRAIVERTQSGFDLAAGALMRGVLVDGATPRLLLVAHHLVVDAYSWRVIEEDLQHAYDRPAAPLPTKTCSVRQYAERAYAAYSDTPETEAAYWCRAEAAARLPSPGTARPDAARSRLIVVPQAIGDALASDVHAAFNTNTQDFLLAALAEACAGWTGSDTLAVMLEGHGRDVDGAPDVGRTVGWFTTMYPVVLDAPADADAASQLKRIKEQLRAVPGQGAGFAASRYLAAQGAPVDVAEPSLCFNYLGRFTAPDAAALLRASSLMHIAQHATRSPAQRRPFALEVLALHDGGRLRVNVVYDATQLAEPVLDALCERLVAALERLVDACRASRGGWTPSDVPDLDLGQDDLDELLDEINELV